MVLIRNPMPTATRDKSLFAITLPPKPGFKRRLVRAVAPAASRLMGLPDVEKLYLRARDDRAPEVFPARVLRHLGVRYDLADEDLARIPKTGPLIVVANHPYGLLDGLLLGAILQRVRTDMKVMVNGVLGRFPEVREVCYFVDPFTEGPEAARANLAGTRQMLRWLRDGHMIGIFPAGEVSHATLKEGRVSDPKWFDAAARFARTANVPVLPIFIEGRNSNLFQTAGLVHPKLRTALLTREFMRMKNARVVTRIGNVIPPARLKKFETDSEATTYLRVRTYILHGRGRGSSAVSPVARDRIAPNRSRATGLTKTSTEDELAPIVSPDVLCREIEELPKESLLATTGAFSVYVGRANQMPGVLAEIGRLREYTFRKVGEGTGRSTDLDRFDRDYHHLFVWHAERREIVGAYRLGFVDEIVAKRGIEGIYTHTLFHFRSKLLEQINPSIELGRSFVRPEYQKEYVPLMLLWRGIGAIVLRRGKYKMLFGPVSISNDYASLSKRLLMSFLQMTGRVHDLSKLIEPRNPPKLPPINRWDAESSSTVVTTIDEVDELVNEIEADRKSLPVLLRQYLKLNAKLLGFNVDPDFGDVLDGLMLVDLTKVDRAILYRMSGDKAAVEAFLARHSR